MKILEVNNLSVSFKNKQRTKNVLNNISFSLEKAKVLGIVGESGSGKSITALSILKLLPKNAIINSGSIIFFKDGDSADLLKMDEKELLQFRGNNITMIFQEPMTSLNPSLKCGYQVLEILNKHSRIGRKRAKEETLELFKEVKLPDPIRIYKSYPHEISGGQLQRVMIAMAIALKPAILIADEPTTALDVTVQKTILELLKQIQLKYKMSIIFISHDLGVVSQVTDDILVMYEGEVVEYGKNKQVLLNPKQPYTRGLVNCRPDLNISGKRLPILSDFLGKDNRTLNNLATNETVEKEESVNEIVLKINKLNKIYFSKRNLIRKSKQQKALSDLSFNVIKGETLGLVGESGCGKTTLGRTIVQLIEKKSGSIEFKGKQINNLGKNELKNFRKKVQIIFQDPYSSINPKLTIGSILMEPLIVHGLFTNKAKRKEWSVEMLKKVRLDSDSFYKYPHEFSGGQRQRIVIARALILQPEFIICDEPVSALDVSVQAEILNLLNDLKREYGLTYIFISHDLSVVKYMADRIMVMKDGKLIEINKADEIYNSPTSDYTKKLIESIPVIQPN